MAGLLQTLSTASFVLAVVFLAVGVALFFILDIRSVIGELTGKTATTEIARIREQGTTRQYKGRSLQSIVLDSDGASADFSLDKLDLDADVETSEQATSFLGGIEQGEQATGLLVDVEAREQLTVLLADDETSEQGTSLLASHESSEQVTSLLGNSGQGEQSEQATGLLGDDESGENGQSKRP